MDIRCVHGDIHSNPVVTVEKNIGLRLILGTDWPGFNKLVGQYVGVHSRLVGTWDMCAVLSGDTRLSNAADGEEERLRRRLCRFPYYTPWKIFHSSSLVMILYTSPSTK